MSPPISSGGSLKSTGMKALGGSEKMSSGPRRAPSSIDARVIVAVGNSSSISACAQVDTILVRK